MCTIVAMHIMTVRIAIDSVERHRSPFSLIILVMIDGEKHKIIVNTIKHKMLDVVSFILEAPF